VHEARADSEKAASVRRMGKVSMLAARHRVWR
jgi:hypothetical protein